MNTKLPDQPSDPKLVEAMEKIKSIVKEYDCGALVSLHGKAHAEYLNHFTPSWSAMFWDKDAEGRPYVRFRCKVATGTDEEKERGRLTVSMILGMGDCTDELQLNLRRLVIMLGKHMKIDHVSKDTPRFEL